MNAMKYARVFFARWWSFCAASTLPPDHWRARRHSLPAVDRGHLGHRQRRHFLRGTMRSGDQVIWRSGDPILWAAVFLALAVFGGSSASAQALEGIPRDLARQRAPQLKD